MSSSPGPYKSQLFSQLNRQSLRWRDRLGQTVRQLKTAAVWGVQALIYPLYWLFQPRRLGLPDGSQEHHALPPAPSPALDISGDTDNLLCDRPIYQTLLALDPWLKESAETSLPVPVPAITLALTTPGGALTPGTKPSFLDRWRSGSSLQSGKNNQAIVIQGIASRCDTRQLVLTTPENLTLDVLSLEQQQILQRLIRREFAQWVYDRRQCWALNQQTWHGMPLLQGSGSAVLAPLTWVWRGMYYWEQRPPLPTLADTAGQSFPLSSLGELTTELTTLTGRLSVPVLRETLTTVTAQSQQVSAQIMQQVAHLLPQGSLSPNPNPDPYALVSLIQAAIAHFFGPSAAPSLPDAPSSLSWTELFGESPNPVPLTPAPVSSLTVADPTVPQAPTVSPKLPELTDLGDPWDEHWVDTPGIRPALESTQALATPKAHPLETAFDWIETPAQPLGYDKHFLVWCLELLDQWVYAIEEGIKRIWIWFKGRVWGQTGSSLTK